MPEDFLLRSLLGGMAIAAATGPLGAFVVWRRMAFFGEALANAALLGVVLGVLLRVAALPVVVGVVVLLALLLTALERRRIRPVDTLLSILSHGALATGLVLLALLDRFRVDLMSYLFGDILAVSFADLALILAVLAFVTTGLVAFWRPLLAITVDAEIAAVEGVPVERFRLLLTLLLAAVIAVGMKLVGILLVVSLLIVPAAAARRLAATPAQMAVLAGLAGVASVAAGLFFSLHLDVPAGPAIVVVAVALFAATQLVPVRDGR
jgi:zinc transport system permease protein